MASNARDKSFMRRPSDNEQQPTLSNINKNDKYKNMNSKSNISYNKNDTDEYKRRKYTSMNVIDFAHNKGTKNAIQNYRYKQEKKRLNNTIVLNNYKKLMIKEGYTPGTGIKRKRKRKNDTTSDNENDNVNDTTTGMPIHSTSDDVENDDDINDEGETISTSLKPPPIAIATSASAAAMTPTDETSRKRKHDCTTNIDKDNTKQQPYNNKKTKFNRFTKAIIDNTKRTEYIEQQKEIQKQNEINRQNALKKRHVRHTLLKQTFSTNPNNNSNNNNRSSNNNNNNNNNNKRQKKNTSKMKFVVHDILNRLQQTSSSSSSSSK